MVFDGMVSRRMQIITMYVVYNGWKVGMLYIMYVYGVYGGKQYENEMPRVNGMKDVQRQGIKLCAIFR